MKLNNSIRCHGAWSTPSSRNVLAVVERSHGVGRVAAIADVDCEWPDFRGHPHGQARTKVEKDGEEHQACAHIRIQGRSREVGAGAGPESVGVA